jgi:hypothetical protein
LSGEVSAGFRGGPPIGRFFLFDSRVEKLSKSCNSEGRVPHDRNAKRFYRRGRHFPGKSIPTIALRERSWGTLNALQQILSGTGLAVKFQQLANAFDLRA